MREALVFSKSQKMSVILLIILTCAVLFLSRGQVSGNTYLLAIFGWPFVIFLLNLFRRDEVHFVTEDAADEDEKEDKKKDKKKKKK